MYLLALNSICPQYAICILFRRDLEEQVKDLRDLVKSSAASRAADDVNIPPVAPLPVYQPDPQAMYVIPQDASQPSAANDAKVTTV